MDFIDYIQKYKGQHIFIQTHNFPDPDALGSAYGLANLLAHYDIETTLCYDGRIDKLSTRRIMEEFNMEIFSKDQLKDMNENSPIILVDSQKNSGNVTDLIGDEVACIDHHPTIVDIDYEYKEVQIVGACCTLIAKYFKKYQIEPDIKTATALLYGLKMDTNNFTRGVTDADIEMYAYLNQYSDMVLLNRVSCNTLEFSDLSAYGAVFETIQVFDRIGIAHIPFPCPDALIAMTSDFILALENVDFVIIYAKRDNDWKFSVRSETPAMDAGEIIHEALLGIGNGGGHAAMAGGMISKENLYLLGPKPDNKLCELFLSTIKRLSEEADESDEAEEADD